jgi:hypothetical protein
MDFTKKQISLFISYEMVRSSGIYNMFDPRAREATALTKEEYVFVMDNYSELKEAYEAVRADEMLLSTVDHS